jgi:RNA polymerase sigma factor (sigma-70 family)
MHPANNHPISIRTLLETRFPDYWTFSCNYACCRYPGLDAEDIAGEAIRSALHANSIIAPLAIYAYLKRTIDRIGLRTYRRRIPTVHFVSEPPDLGPSQNERIEDLERAIGLLDPKLRAVIELLIHGHTFVEVANQLGLSESAVKARRKAARKRLKKRLSE